MHGGGWWAYIRYDETKTVPAVDRALLKRVAGWARPYAGRITVTIVLLLLVALIELIPPLLIGELINSLSYDTLTLPRLNLLAIGLLGVPIVSSLLGVAQRHLSASTGEGLIHDLRVAMYKHMQRMGLRFFTDTKTGDIISRFSNDVVGAQTAVTSTIPNLITNVLTLTTTLAIMLRLDWRLTLLAVAALPLFLLPTRRVGRLLRRIRREAAEHDARMSSQIQETLNVSGALLVRTFGRQAAAVRDFDDAAGAVRDIGVRRAVVGRWFFFGLGVAAALGSAIMYWAGGYLVYIDELSVGLIVTFAAYVTRLYQPIMGLSNLQVEFATSLVSFERVFEYLDLPVEVAEPEAPRRLATVRGRVELKDVQFSYRAGAGDDDTSRLSDDEPDAVDDGRLAGGSHSDGSNSDGSNSDTHDTASGTQLSTDISSGVVSPEARGREWALDGVSFVAEPGQVVALVGPSGAGKSTVTYLVTRLYDPTNGTVSLDSIDLRDLALADVAAHVGMVTQEAYLFHDTVRANLTFAKDDATDDELVRACQAANVHDVILDMPDGFDTVVGERGYRMSGGEKQRLALARVILKDPTVLVLDEATSHLDSQSEALIQQALERLMRGRTSLVIAHRLSTVLAADQILVFDRGRVVERGTHRELVAKGGLYARLYETQFRDRDAGKPPASS